MINLSDAEKWKLLADQDKTQAASLMTDQTKEKASEIAEELGLSYMVEVVEKLNSDEASDLLRSLPEDFRLKVIEGLSPKKRELIEEILSYAPHTAGSLMSKEFLSIPVHFTIGQATQYLQSMVHDKKGKVSYIYVVDKNNRLEGVIQIRDLIFHPLHAPVKKILVSPVVQVETGMSQMDVAKLLQRHRYLGLPVVDADQKLVGVISADNALQILEEEAIDDIAKAVGTSAEEVKTRSTLRILQLRLPWLCVSIASGLLCAFILNLFDQGSQTLILLFLFVPVVLGVSESAGVQGATIVVQNLASGNASFKDLGALLFREIFVGVLIGIICGCIVGVVASYWQANPSIGLALALSMILTISLSALIGAVLPLLFRSFKIDPAMASGPLVLAICDIQTLAVYFSVAGAILSRLAI